MFQTSGEVFVPLFWGVGTLMVMNLYSGTIGYVFKYHALALYACMFMFMGLDSHLIWCVVASSLPVGGSGML